MKKIRVTYGLSVHDENEIKAVNAVLKTSTQMGKNVFNFEKKISKLFQKKYGLMVNSGTSALFLALESLGLPRYSEVITPVLTFSTTVSSIIKNNLIPVFIDVKENTYCIDESKIENLISKKTKVISVPNLIGNIPDWQVIYKIAKKYKLIIIEDSADALGAKYNSISTGKFSDISITSFYGSHIINCAGNGGMVCFNNVKYYKKAKLLRSWGRNSSLFQESEKIKNRFNISLNNIPYDSKFVFSEIGYNFEPSEIGAAFGLEQLKKLNKNISLRERNFKLHNNFFKKYSQWFNLPQQLNKVKTGWLAYPLKIKKNKYFDRRALQIFLEKNNIQTRVIFTGNILKQPGFKKIKKRITKEGYPVADDVMRGGFMIAVHHGLDLKMINYIYSKFDKFMKIKCKKLI
mgnify:FL=1|jgi:CDP-6-deoxy-D-xylo-4-hexulose-3-dehydrase|tara:strand:+ start:5092 stop:6303 length:1212 start_codon:yes stop_codon:yes gene_type:complete